MASETSCQACGRENPAANRFCGACGASLARACAACGHANPADHRFCGACGAALAGQSARAAGAAAETRKVVTVVFADLIGSTSLHERLDAESTRRLMERYYRALRAAVAAHGGTVIKLLGDGVLAAFGVPLVSEDDAMRAVRAAVAMQAALGELASGESAAVGAIGLRVGVNTGEVVVGANDDDDDVVGDPVNVAARLQQAARDGEVLIGESTRRLVEGLVTLAPIGALSLRGRSETVAAYRVVSLERSASATTTAFVGRDEELRRIQAVFDAAVAAPGARLAVILGSPGLGKSRLLDEFARRLGERATVLTARCDPTTGPTFAPLTAALRGVLRADAGGGADALRDAVDALVAGDESERARIAAGIAALLGGTPAAPEETFYVVRRVLAARAAARPLVLAIDDLQWAEPLLFELTEHLVQWSTDVPLLVLVAGRPELRDARSSLTARGGLVSDVINLAGLDAGAATRLAANVIGADELPAALAGRVLSTSEGNPLFVGELVRMLVQDGALRREGDRWTTGVEVASLEMPPTIHALLAARIERLRPEERIVLERAAVVGRRFSRAAVAHLLPSEITDLDARLEALRRTELIEPESAWFLGEPVLRFHHALIRDAAYRSMLKGTRAELHGRFADWIERRVGPAAVEYDETMGWHLEQAYQHLRELGPLDAQGRSLGDRAARHLGDAGRRALARDDLPVAASLLGRALHLLDESDRMRAELALDWCEALLASGEVGTAAGAIAELARFADGGESPAGGAAARLRAWHTCFAGQRAVLTDPQALRATADAVAAAAATLAESGDTAGEAKAHSVHALALARLGAIGACEAALDRALAAARRAHDRRRSNAVLAGAPPAALWGPGPVTRASGRCLDVVRVLRITQGAPAVEAVALRCQAVLEALRGRIDAARRMIASSRRMVEELGITQRLLEADVFAGLIESLDGDAVAAERHLRAAYDGLRRHGLGIDAAQAGALLGRALLAQGRDAEAEALSHDSEALAGDDLKAAIAWRGVRAQALAQRGEHAAAIDFARAAVDIAAQTDALLDHADARLALAAALRAAGRDAEAAVEEARAIELWEAKGATLLADRARKARAVAPAPAPTRPRESPPPPATCRRVRPNFATEQARRLTEAMTTRNEQLLATLIGDDCETTHHPTGVQFGRDGALGRFHAALAADDLALAHEPMASLGDSLALCRAASSASGIRDDTLSVGAFETDLIAVIEANARAQSSRVEIFAGDRLADAIIRLYARYAELLPAGAARERATRTAQAVAAMLAVPDPDRIGAIFAPDVEFADHRTLGTWSVRGAAAAVELLRSLVSVSQDITVRIDDVLDVVPDAYLLRWATLGTDLASGGAYERPFLMLCVFTGGLLTRCENFDLGDEGAALARFAELTGDGEGRPFTPAMSALGERRPERESPPIARFAEVTRPLASAAAAPAAAERVRRNAAAANAARLDAAFEARDAAALDTVFADVVDIVHHPTGTTYDRAGALFSLRALLRADDAAHRHQPLATLGDALLLCRLSTSFSGLSGDDLGPFGAVEKESVLLIEVDERGRTRQAEFFAADRLGDAVERLYERYAERLPDGGARERAAATARAVAAMFGVPEVSRLAATFAPTIELVDHRAVGTWSARGAAAALEHFRALCEVADDIFFTHSEVLCVRPDALLVCRTHCGTERVGGGAYERPFLILLTFGSDGRMTRIEWFDAGDDAAALARFDELVARHAEPIPAAGPLLDTTCIENAATRCMRRFERAWAARDWDVASIYTPAFRLVDRRTTVHLDLDREQHLRGLRPMFDMESSRFTLRPFATRGDRLALARARFESSGGSIGPSEAEWLQIVEADAGGDCAGMALFDLGDLSAAYAELERRHAAGEGAPYGHILERMRMFAVRDWDGFAEILAPDFVVTDHRPLGWETLSGPAYIGTLKSLVTLAPDVQFRLDHVQICDGGIFQIVTWVGTRDGGAFESERIVVVELDGNAEIRRFDFYDREQLEQALAHFGTLRGAPRAPRVETAEAAEAGDARRAALTQAFTRAFAERDWEALAALLAPDLVVNDHRLLGWETLYGPPAYIRALQELVDLAPDVQLRVDHLAMSESRSLYVATWLGTREGGAFETPSVIICELDAIGRIRRFDQYDMDQLGAARATVAETGVRDRM